MPFRRQRKKRLDIKAAKGECVYLVEAGEAVKIGYSKNVSKRMEHLQVGCAAKIRLIRTWFDGRARIIERTAHQFFRPYRTDGKGEWFAIEPSLAQIVIDELFLQFPRNAANQPERKILLVCKSCGHGALVLNSTAGRFRCSTCGEMHAIRHHALPCQVWPNSKSAEITTLAASVRCAAQK